jgi:phosphoserine phosphatase
MLERMMAISPKWAVVAVDLDGTLIHGTTASLHLGDWIGHRLVIENLERRFAAGEIDSAAVADGDASYYRGRTIDQVAAVMASAPCIDDIRDGVQRLNERGVSAVICTVAWSFAAQCLVSCVRGA